MAAICEVHLMNPLILKTALISWSLVRGPAHGDRVTPYVPAPQDVPRAVWPEQRERVPTSRTYPTKNDIRASSSTPVFQAATTRTAVCDYWAWTAARRWPSCGTS